MKTDSVECCRKPLLGAGRVIGRRVRVAVKIATFGFRILFAKLRLYSSFLASEETEQSTARLHRGDARLDRLAAKWGLNL